MRVGILGPLEVEHDDRPVEVSGGRLRALLARLALDPGRPVTVGRLVDAVWADELPGDELHALQSLVSRLRRSLGDGEVIEPAPGGYRLAVEPHDVDAERFEHLAAEGAAALRAGDPERASATLGDALAEWRGPALADVLLPFATTAAGRLEDARLAVVADRTEAELELGRGAPRVTELEALTAEHPLHERLAGLLVRSLAAAGRQADALAAYERTRVRLAEELGVGPSAALAAVHLGVLRGDPATPERPARRSNLRAPVNSFVGREQDLADIGALLGQARLVTLVGPGGAGKTRLAGEAVAAWSDRVADGVWMVELAPVTDDAEIVPAVLSALGIREPALLERSGPTARAPRAGLERLFDVLGDREAILVLDNCEHLVAAAADLADRLLGHCPRLRIVATSREPLAIAGERLAPVPPLPLPAAGASVQDALAHPAIELFADRAAAASPGFVVDATTVELAVEVCRRLDGLPLAIELAAARLRSMPLQSLAERLDDRFRLLTGGSRTALPRHRTLRAVVDWSWELLDEPERRLARRLAVLRGGATAESARAICAEPDAAEADVHDDLAALAERSLLQAVPGSNPPRYRMLETIREYGLEKLAEAGELATVRTAHAHWFAELAARADPELRGPNQAHWFRRLSDDRDDLAAAMRWLGESGDAAGTLRLAVKLLWFWMLAGWRDEARAWTEFALSVPGEADPIDRLVAEGVQALSLAGGGRNEGDPDAGAKALAGIAARLDELGPGELPFVALARPVLALVAGDMETANRRLAEALEHPDPWARATALVMRAHLAENDGDQTHMRADLERAAVAFREIGDNWGLAMTLASQAGTWMLDGALDDAEAALDEALDLVVHVSGSAGGEMLELHMADVRLRRGDLEGARAAALRAQEKGSLGTDADLYIVATLARIAGHAGDFDEVRRQIVAGQERLDRIGPQRPEQGHSRVMIDLMSAMVALHEGDLDAAYAELETAHAAAVGTSDLPVLAAVGVAGATVAAKAGRHVEAAEMLGAAATLRGAEDDTNPDVRRPTAALREALGEEGFAAAYGRGRALDREAAIARLHPAGSRTAPVGP